MLNKLATIVVASMIALSMWSVPSAGAAALSPSTRSGSPTSPEPAQRIEISDVRLSPKTIYTTVRDGYRDRTRFSYRLSRGAQVVIRVRGPEGRLIDSWTGNRREGRSAFVWDGRDRRGDIAPVGRYGIFLIATDKDGRHDRADRSVQVDRKIGRRTHTQSRLAFGAGRRHSGNCTFQRDTTYPRPTVFIGCRGGQATMTWSLSVPSNAGPIGATAYGYRSLLDGNGGRIYLTCARPGREQVRCELHVTGNRAWNARRLEIRYRVPVQLKGAASTRIKTRVETVRAG